MDDLLVYELDCFLLQNESPPLAQSLINALCVSKLNKVTKLQIYFGSVCSRPTMFGKSIFCHPLIRRFTYVYDKPVKVLITKHWSILLSSYMYHVVKGN